MIIAPQTDSLNSLVEKAAKALANGELVALPTETVYGLAADAANGKAVANIFEVKGRPHFNPLIAHVDGQLMAKQYVEIDPISQRLMDMFWPGPLTFVLPLLRQANIHPLISAGLPTMALRCPVGIFAKIVTKLGRPVVAPSANRSGRLSPTNAQAVADDLENQISFIIDGGQCHVGVESTIVKVEHEDVFLLRPGGLAAEDIENVLNKKLIRLDQLAAIEAPGMMQSHYAPKARVRMNASEVKHNEALLAYGKNRIKGAENARLMLNLSETGDMREAAVHLFSYMKKLDQKNIEMIAVEPIPNIGLGEAINDRLQRASAPRSDKE